MKKILALLALISQAALASTIIEAGDTTISTELLHAAIYENPQTISISLIGQSNANGAPDNTSVLSDVILSGVPNAFISNIGEYTVSSGGGWDYQQQLSYTNHNDYNNDILWGVELMIGSALSGLDYTNYWYKSAVGGAGTNTFTASGVYWEYVTNAYESATSEWANATAPDIVLFMRGETGADYQTQTESYNERLQQYTDLTNYYGNADLHFIMAGLPETYYALSSGPNVEAGMVQLADASDNCWYVKMYDIAVGDNHYNGSQLSTVASRLMGAITQAISTDRKHIDIQRTTSEMVYVDQLFLKSRDINEQILSIISGSALPAKYNEFYHSFDDTVVDPIHSVTGAINGAVSLDYDNERKSDVCNFGSTEGVGTTFTSIGATLYPSTNWVCSFWYKGTGNPANDPEYNIIGNGSSGTYFSIDLVGSADNGFLIGYRVGGAIEYSSIYLRADMQASWDSGEWHHYIITCEDSTNTTLYADGEYHDVTWPVGIVNPGTIDRASSPISTLGHGWSPTRLCGLVGELDSVMFFNDITMTADEAKVHYLRSRYNDDNIKGYR